ncbi:MAG TPA: FtsX-like permease family protein, partial [Longimicrobiales bacterium]|nr:FtsX-like permease family protein [Longimicrobiales bacterium]
SLEALVDGQTQPYEVTAVLVGLFGALALLLAAVGLYGVVSFLVSQRTREIGIRMALGADAGRVAGSVLRSGGRLVAIGMVLGLAGSIALRGFTEGMLYGVEPGDPLPLVGATVVLIAVAGLASLVPARRATRVDPLVAMRAD